MAAFIDQGNNDREPYVDILKIWLFANNGVTVEAKTLLEAHDILWSERKDMDGLLQYLNLRQLPDI
jgi:hypothetical protein